MIKRTGILFVLLLFVLFGSSYSKSRQSPTTDSPAPQPQLTAEEIFRHLDEANEIRSNKLKGYTSTRRYSVYEPNRPPDAALSVSMQFVAPSTKIFKTISQDGVGFIHKLVFNELIKAEQQTSAGKSQTSTAISSDNYSAKLEGEEVVQGRPAYVLQLQPRREDKYLMYGKIWVDKEDFAIARLEGDPMKNLSFWVTRSHLVRQYEKIGDFWLQLQDETACQIRFVGPYFLKIEYGNYKLDGSS